MPLDDSHLTSLETLKAWLLPKPSSGISSVTPTAQGHSYTTATVTLTDVGPGDGAVVSATIIGGAVVGYVITSPGQNYISPTVTVTGDGTGATASVATGDDDALTALITDVSQAVLNQANIARFYDNAQPITEVRNGNNHTLIVPRVRPVTGILSVMIGYGTSGYAVPPSINGAPGYLFDGNAVYLIGYRFERGQQNVTIIYTAGETQGSQRASNAERATIATAALWWKRRAQAHLTNESASQGTGVSVGINTRDFPAEATAIISNLQRYNTALGG